MIRQSATTRVANHKAMKDVVEWGPIEVYWHCGHVVLGDGGQIEATKHRSAYRDGPT